MRTEGLAARGRGGQGFGQVVKSRWVHIRLFLSCLGNGEPLLIACLLSESRQR